MSEVGKAYEHSPSETIDVRAAVRTSTNRLLSGLILAQIDLGNSDHVEGATDSLLVTAAALQAGVFIRRNVSDAIVAEAVNAAGKAIKEVLDAARD